MSKVRPTTIAIHALGGQGGGVLADWLVETAENAGYFAQYTFIAGVAQRTGATVYYIEIFPNKVAEKAKQKPVMALMPVAGDVDIVIASELMEAGRSVSRGFVTPDKTTLIASSHRIYAIDEKMAMGDGRKDDAPILEAAEASAKHFVHFDMEELAKENGTIISAVMFGALAGSGALPISREAFEDVIKHAGRAVATNLAGFAAGFEQAQAKQEDRVEEGEQSGIKNVSSTVQPLLNDLTSTFPVETHEMLREGLRRVVDFQDIRYGELYLDRMKKVIAADKGLSGVRQNWRLTSETARYLALAMSFEDTIRVADFKTRDSRAQRVRDEVKAQPGQIIETTEFLHPRIEEICDLLPNGIGRFIMQRTGLKTFLGRFFKKGRFIKTDKLWGFILLYFVASLRPIRRASYRYALETVRIERWLGQIEQAAQNSYEDGCALATCQRLVKGYGSTHARGLKNFAAITGIYEKLQSGTDASKTLYSLIDAALADEDGKKLQLELSSI